MSAGVLLASSAAFHPSMENTLLRQQHLLAGHQPTHSQVELEVAQQAFALGSDLLEQHAAHGTWADQANRNRVRRKIEPGMHCTQRARRFLLIDDHGNVALGRALRDRMHVDARRAERVEHLARHAGQARHAIADHRQDRQIAIDRDALDLAFLDLAIERGGDHARGAFGFDARNGAADRVLGAALRNEDDRDALFAQRAEQTMRGAGYADHAGAFDIDHRDVFDRGDALDGQLWSPAWRRSASPASAGRMYCGSRSGCRGPRPGPWSADE